MAAARSRAPRAGQKPHITPKAERPVARVVSPPPYVPELDAYGLKLTEAGVVPVVECPDDTRPLPEILADPTVQIDARLWEGRFEHGRLRESRTTKRLSREDLNQQVTKLRESDWFSLGASNGVMPIEGPLTANYVPMIPGPATRQQYWTDYWASSAKAFEASTHSGIARRACRAMVQFPLGRGVRWKFEDPKAQDAWEAFWDGNNMRARLRSILYDLAVFGEQFLRYFPPPVDNPDQLLTVRQLDPATIYEVVTDQEDLETVYFYHQQFQTRMELYSPPVANKAPEGRTQTGVTRYIIRQIDASEVDHWRINTVSGEARGRSDLFPVLGDLKRLRDLLTSKVIASDIGNRVMAVVKANGTQADINRVVNQMFPGGQPPAPGSVIGLNQQTDIEPFEYSGGREVRADFTYDELIDSIAAGTGIARAYLGLSPSDGSGTTQATSLTQTTPSTKSFEERQDITEEGLDQMKRRVMKAADLDPDTPVEWIFPELAKEDSSTKLDDLAQAEGMGWISKRTAANQGAAELGLNDYDFDDEMKAIVEEFDDADETDGKTDMGADKPAQGGKIRRPMILASQRQTPKLDPTKAQQGDDEPPGMLVGAPGAPATAPPGPGADPNTGVPPVTKNPASAAGAAAIKRSTREAADGHLRRTPDDPEFVGNAQELAERTAANLKALLGDLDH